MRRLVEFILFCCLAAVIGSAVLFVFILIRLEYLASDIKVFIRRRIRRFLLKLIVREKRELGEFFEWLRSSSGFSEFFGDAQPVQKIHLKQHPSSCKFLVKGNNGNVWDLQTVSSKDSSVVEYANSTAILIRRRVRGPERMWKMVGVNHLEWNRFLIPAGQVERN